MADREPGDLTMRVLMVSDFYPPLLGGVEVVVRNFALALSARGHHVSVATIRADGLPAFGEDGPVRVHRMRCSAQRLDALFSQSRPWAPPIPDPEAVRELRRVIARERPDVVHGHDWLARSFLPLRRAAGAALVFSLHYYTLTCPKKTLLYRDGELCAGPALAKCLGCAGEHYGRAKGAGIVAGNLGGAAAERRAADLFLPVSQATAEGNGLPESGVPFEVLPNFVLDAPPLGPAERELVAQLPPDGFLLYVGDLRAEKGIHVLLEAYRGLEGAPPLVLIGKTWPQSPTELPPGVRFLENWPNAAVREAQRHCRALIVPSLWSEPFGAVVIEALAAGRPVVASRAGGIVDLVQHGENGLLVERGDAGALRAALQRISEDDALVESLAHGARGTAARFSSDAVLPRLERAYERAIELARAR